MSTQLEFFIQKGLDHAGAEWASRALDFLTRYAATHYEFMTEQVREAAYEEGLPRPPDGRAWGGIIRMAVDQKVMRKVDHRLTHMTGNTHTKPLWRSRIFKLGGQ